MLGIEVITGSDLSNNELQYTLLILELVRFHLGGWLGVDFFFANSLTRRDLSLKLCLFQLASDLDTTASEQSGSGSSSHNGTLKATFAHIAYDVFRLVMALAVRMYRLSRQERSTVNGLNLQAMSKSIHSSKVGHVQAQSAS